jgi:hypothetical protein
MIIKCGVIINALALGILVCFKEFMGQIRNWSQKPWATTGKAHLESRSKHANRPHKTVQLYLKSMNTFSHLKQEGPPEDLKVCKLH